jgi:hypothetical protein
MRSSRKQSKRKAVALVVDEARWSLNAKGKHVIPLVRAPRRDLQGIRRAFLERSALPVVQPIPDDDPEQNAVNQETSWGGSLMGEFPMNIETDGLWNENDLDWVPGFTDNYDKDLDLGSFGNQ